MDSLALKKVITTEARTPGPPIGNLQTVFLQRSTPLTTFVRFCLYFRFCCSLVICTYIYIHYQNHPIAIQKQFDNPSL